MKLFKKTKKGFTLVELVVVIAVIAILSAVSVGAYFGITTSANQSATEQEAKAFHTNLVLLANTPDNGFCTMNSKGLVATKTHAEIVTEIERVSGASYANYNITFNEVNDGDDALDTITFDHKTNDSTVTIDIVTGA